MSLEIANIILQAKLPGTDAITMKNVTFSGVSSLAWCCIRAISHMRDIRIPISSSCYCNQNVMCDKTVKLHDKWHTYNTNIATMCRVHSGACEKNQIKKLQMQGIPYLAKIKAIYHMWYIRCKVFPLLYLDGMHSPVRLQINKNPDAWLIITLDIFWFHQFRKTAVNSMRKMRI